MKIDRLIGILMMLINKEKVTARQLSEYFEVSLRTIQRDMDTLMMAGIPLYADVGINGGYQLLDSFKLERGFLNKKEAGILFTFLKGLEGVTPYSEVESIYHKFASLDQRDMESSRLVVKVYSDDDSNTFKTHLSILSKAAMEQQKVQMTYYDVNLNQTQRVLCSYTLALLGTTWYVYGFCELRSDFRMFKLSRIADCQIIDESFERMELPEQMPWDTEMDEEQKCQEIQFQIDRSQQNILPDYITPSNCQVLEDKIVVRMHCAINEWLYSQLMSFVPYIEILQPESLRKGFVKRLQESIALNSWE